MKILTNKELLEKADLTTADFGGSDEAPLSIEQFREFQRLAITPQVVLPEVTNVDSAARKWQQSQVSFNNRIMHPGTESTRLDSSDRVAPSTNMVEIDTTLLRGEVPVSDEVFEDQVEGDAFGTTLSEMLAEAVGRDVEELAIQADNGDAIVNHGEGASAYLQQFDGWIKQAHSGTGANTYDATGDGTDYQKMFKELLDALPDRYKRDRTNWRYYVPVTLEEQYRDILANRATGLGDMALQGNNEITYQGIVVRGVPLFPVNSDVSFILLANRRNLYMGWHRRITVEQFRDPREGQRSYTVTARVDAKIAEIPATALAYNVSV